MEDNNSYFARRRNSSPPVFFASTALQRPHEVVAARELELVREKRDDLGQATPRERDLLVAGAHLLAHVQRGGLERL